MGVESDGVELCGKFSAAQTAQADGGERVGRSAILVFVEYSRRDPRVYIHHVCQVGRRDATVLRGSCT